MDKFEGKRGRARATRRLDQLPLDRIHHSLKTIVGAQLLIDVVKMIAKRLGADIQNACDLVALFALCEHA